MKERNEIRETLKDLKARGEEIKESVLPKSITPEMVGGTLSGLAEAMDQTLEGLRLSVYGFDKIIEEEPDEDGKIKTTDPEGTIVFCRGAFSISRKGNYELIPEGAYNKAEGGELRANAENLFIAGTEIHRVAEGDPATLERAFVRPEEATVEIVVVSAGEQQINAAPGCFYRCDGEVENLEINLESALDVLGEDTTLKSIGFQFTTGSAPQVELTCGKEIEYYSGFAIEPNTTYEINAMWNGKKWVVAYGIVE